MVVGTLKVKTTSMQVTMNNDAPLVWSRTKANSIMAAVIRSAKMAHLNTFMKVLREKFFSPTMDTPAEVSNMAPATRHPAATPKGAFRGAYDAMRMPPTMTNARVDAHCVATRVIIIKVATCIRPVMPAV